ncbi:MAG: hypothetical protein WAT91_15775, partial [Saprospiraceae bacterium]
NNLDFNSATSGRLVTGNFDVKLTSAATVTGVDADEYVATTGTGGLQKSFTGGATFLFPVGDVTNYTPLSSTFVTTTPGSIRTRVNAVVHPNKPAAATDFISRYWDVDQTGLTGYTNTMTGTYVAGDVTGTASLVKGAVYNGSSWSYAGADNSGSTVIGSTTTANADFTGTNFFGKANLIAYLRGAYLNGTGTMSTTLNTLGVIPTTSPYGDGATVASIPANVTDWVKLELRDPASPSTVLGSAPAFIKNTGNIVGLDGTSLPLIKNGKPTSIVNIIHRSHLPIRTPNVGIDVVNPTTYDFSLALANAYKNVAITTNEAMMLMADGKYVMWGGNGNGNTAVRYTTGTSDEAYLLGTVLGGNTATIITGAASYTSGADMNMNGTIRYTTGSSDESFLLGTMLGGNTATIINQHQ